MDDSTGDDEKLNIVEALRQFLLAAKVLREQADSEPTAARDRLRLRDWQASRLARSHADLLLNPRYGLAAKFFLSDLYGSQDFSSRDEEIERILPMLTSLLPASALQTIALAVELDALTEDLDSAMVGELSKMGIDAIDDGAYSAAYRAVGRRPERQRQIALIRETGEALEKLARKPLLRSVLKLMRGPAHLAGLGGVQAFLESGFDAFRKMGEATEFLDAIEGKEQCLLTHLFGGAAQPFDIR
ncbi:MAG: hypothetical protein HY777_13595 [Betaproteobacteria bacterium]|nr:hypothetical protein [Betaproteobacteria bacterium]